MDSPNISPGASTAHTLIVSIVFFVMGLTPWLLVNGIFSELPILASTLPEKYSIAAYMVICIQCGNILAFAFAFTQSQKRTFVSPARVVFAVYLLALLVSFLLAFFWSNQVITSSAISRSIPLLVLVFFAGVVGSMSMVSVFPFASAYGVTMIGALSAGSGANGFVPSIIALIQGAENVEPRFSVKVFFFILSGVIALTIACFIWINMHKMPRSFISTTSETEKTPLITNEIAGDSAPALGLLESLKPIAWPLFHECYISILQYILVGILPYAFNGYGDSSRVFLFWNTFAPIIVGAIGRLLTIKIKYLNLLPQSIIQSGMWIFITVQCFIQQHDKSILAWPIATIVCNTIYTALYGYEDTLNYQLVHVYMEPQYFERGTRFMGVFNQIGAFTGSFIGFFLVQYVLT